MRTGPDRSTEISISATGITPARLTGMKNVSTAHIFRNISCVHAARRATMLPRFATDRQHRRTQCCRHCAIVLPEPKATVGTNEFLPSSPRCSHAGQSPRPLRLLLDFLSCGRIRGRILDSGEPRTLPRTLPRKLARTLPKKPPRKLPRKLPTTLSRKLPFTEFQKTEPELSPKAVAIWEIIKSERFDHRPHFCVLVPVQGGEQSKQSQLFCRRTCKYDHGRIFECKKMSHRGVVATVAMRESSCQMVFVCFSFVCLFFFCLFVFSSCQMLILQ